MQLRPKAVQMSTASGKIDKTISYLPAQEGQGWHWLEGGGRGIHSFKFRSLLSTMLSHQCPEPLHPLHMLPCLFPQAVSHMIPGIHHLPWKRQVAYYSLRYAVWLSYVCHLYLYLLYYVDVDMQFIPWLKWSDWRCDSTAAWVYQELPEPLWSTRKIPHASILVSCGLGETPVMLSKGVLISQTRMSRCIVNGCCHEVQQQY